MDITATTDVIEAEPSCRVCDAPVGLSDWVCFQSLWLVPVDGAGEVGALECDDDGRLASVHAHCVETLIRDRMAVARRRGRRRSDG